MSHQHQHVGLFQTSTEDAPVSMSGRLVADDSTSEELLWRGYMKDININTVSIFSSFGFIFAHSQNKGVIFD